MPSFRLTVEGVEKSIIPRVYRLKCRGDAVESAVIEYHEELELEYRSGEELELEFAKSEMKESGPDKYCGRAFLFAIKEEQGSFVYLFSVGGFIIRLEAKQRLRELGELGEYFFCLRKAAPANRV